MYDVKLEKKRRKERQASHGTDRYALTSKSHTACTNTCKLLENPFRLMIGKGYNIQWGDTYGDTIFTSGGYIKLGIPDSLQHRVCETTLPVSSLTLGAIVIVVSQVTVFLLHGSSWQLCSMVNLVDHQHP